MSSDVCSLFFSPGADFVGKCVEFCLGKSVVSTGGSSGSLSEHSDLLLGWVVSWVFVQPVFDGGSEFFFRDLTIMVGVNHIEDLVGFSH